MQGRRSLNFNIIPYDPEIERTIRQPRRQRDYSETEIIFKVEEKMAEAHVENLPEWNLMKSSFVPQNLNQPLCIAFQPNVQRNFNLSPHLLNMVPHYRGTPTDEPYLLIRDFFDLCKMQNIHGLNAEEIRLILFPFLWKILLSCGWIFWLQGLFTIGRSSPQSSWKSSSQPNGLGN